MASKFEELYALFEKQRLHEAIYEYISEDWANKRKRVWTDLETELQEMIINRPKYRICLDAGSGSGRNIQIFLKIAELIIALDISERQINALCEDYIDSIPILEEKENNTIRINPIMADISHPPFRPNSIDFIASISTIHHIRGKKNRISCLNELIKILDLNGLFVYTVWRFDIPKFKEWYEWQSHLFISEKVEHLPKILNEPIEFGDVIVPWTISKKNETYYRFYHLYIQDAVMNELNGISMALKPIIKSFPKEKNENFIIFLKKLVNKN